MKIVAFVQDQGACTNIRLKQPLKKIAKFGLAEVDLIEEVVASEVEKRVKGADVAVMGRAFSEGVISIIKRLQGDGTKVVFDLDDNMFNISPFSPHYNQLGIMPVNFDGNDGQTIPLWMDGNNGFNVRNNRKIRKSFVNTIRLVDVITVTNDVLKNEYLRFNDSVRIVPNAIDFSLWEKPPIRWTRDEVRLLYTGAANHQEDFFFIKDVLKDLQEKYPKLKIIFVGTDWRQISNPLDYTRIESYPWLHIEAYPYFLRGLCCDIGIAPVSKIPFNQCRSAIKWKEYSAMKMATVATDYGPYVRAIDNGVTGLLADTKQDWFDNLSYLIENEQDRHAIAMNAFRAVKRNYNLDYVVEQWMDVFRHITSKED